MKSWIHRTGIAAALAFCVLTTSSFADAVRLRMVRSTNSVVLTADPISEAGALFVYQAPNLSSLTTTPSILFQADNPVGLWLPTEPSDQAYFFAVHWPGRSVAEFGSPEYAPDPPPPGMILIASGLPDSVAAGQVFAVDFFVTDPAGHLLSVSGPVQIFVVRRADGALHPDAQVIPPTQQLVEGHLRAQISLQSSTSLNGYTLGLGPVANGVTAVGMISTALNLGPNLLASPTGDALLQILTSLRNSGTDADSSWSCPLSPPGNWKVAGTFGEWRGKFNQEVHTGLDMAAAADSPVMAARGGVVSCVATLPGMEGSIVIDHGDGLFSRYAELDASSIVVAAGQAVRRGATLAIGLLVTTQGPAHLHFEIRRGDGTAQWSVPAPGSSQDPLQTPGIFAAPAGVRLPQLETIGLTRVHPGQQPFVKTPPDPSATGRLIYLFGQLVDAEPGIDGGDCRLGLRSISFQADGMSQPLVIQPADDASVGELRIPGTESSMGFAKYGLLHAINPDPLNFYQYWWVWSTAAYASNPIGPRTVQLIGQGYSGATVTNALSFGPEIQNNVWQPLSAHDFTITVVAHLGSTNLAPQCAQPDQYRLEVLRADKSTMPGVQWDGTLPGTLSTVFSNHLDAAAYTFHIPAGETATNMVVRVSSLMAPDLRHEVSQGVVQLLGRASNAPVLVDIPAGTFIMGSPATEAERFTCEGPQTTVTISYSFKMAKYAVTQGQYKSVVGSNPSYFSGVADRPVEQVSWSDATNYCFLLTRLEQQAGFLPANWAYRLPTEAEREYACRAGTTTAFHYGPALRSAMANFNGRYEYDATLGTTNNPNGIFAGTPEVVGSYAPNDWGLCDMHGNVWEWCFDSWSSSLPGGSVTNPSGPPPGPDRMIRGGAWYDNGSFCRSAFRLCSAPSYRGNDTGFRMVLAPSPP